MTVSFMIFTRLKYLLAGTGGAGLKELLVGVVVGLAILCTVAYPIHKVRSIIQKLQTLAKQQGHFSIRDADCFCCSNRHVHPETGEALPCDGEVIFSTLKSWFPQ